MKFCFAVTGQPMTTLLQGINQNKLPFRSKLNYELVNSIYTNIACNFVNLLNSLGEKVFSTSDWLFCEATTSNDQDIEILRSAFVGNRTCDLEIVISKVIWTSRKY